MLGKLVFDDQQIFGKIQIQFLLVCGLVVKKLCVKAVGIDFLFPEVSQGQNLQVIFGNKPYPKLQQLSTFTCRMLVACLSQGHTRESEARC
jgi:hypothetical protein